MVIPEDLIDYLFGLFWCAGMRKAGSRKITRKTFAKVLKDSKQDPIQFTDMLIQDIERRLSAKQFGFDRQHPRSYLNGECWDDEVIDDAKNRHETMAAGRRLSAVDRVRARTEENRANRAAARGDGGHVANTDGYIRVVSSEPIRGGDAGGVGITIEGDYTQTNS